MNKLTQLLSVTTVAFGALISSAHAEGPQMMQEKDPQMMQEKDPQMKREKSESSHSAEEAGE